MIAVAGAPAMRMGYFCIMASMNGDWASAGAAGRQQLRASSGASSRKEKRA